MRLCHRLSETIGKVLTQNRTIQKQGARAETIGVEIVGIPHSSLTCAGDFLGGAIHIIGGNKRSSCGGSYRGGQTIYAVFCSSFTTELINLFSNAPKQVVFCGFGRGHGADIAANGQRAPGGIVGIACDGFRRDHNIAILDFRANRFHQLLSGVIAVVSRNAILIRFTELAAAHPFGRGETTIAVRGLNRAHLGIIFVCRCIQ